MGRVGLHNEPFFFGRLWENPDVINLFSSLCPPRISGPWQELSTLNVWSMFLSNGTIFLWRLLFAEIATTGRA